MKLVTLIRETESMNEEEKQYWITLIPNMKDSDKEKLEAILTKEKETLAEIDARFNI